MEKGIESPWFEVPGGGGRGIEVVWLTTLVCFLVIILLDLRLPAKGGDPGEELETLVLIEGVEAGDGELVSGV